MFDSADMFRAFVKHREKAIVLVTGTSGRDWRDVSDDENRDLSLQGAMGQTNTAALGFALAQPSEKVVLFDSEGALQMNMGVLGTVAGMKPKNFFHFLMDNECYATTGGQPVPNAGDINYAGMAREAGYAATFEFDNLEDFADSIEAIMKEEGPVFVAMKMIPKVENEPIGRRVRKPQRTRAETIKVLQSELGISVV
ncbi:MAG: thiamine pyrophosphate-dependent enzyme [Dehalococcoidia bacterium]|nr:thiamine pyrophosphate-dependent enzyme [Dehalococcoidia bacterium]